MFTKSRTLLFLTLMVITSLVLTSCGPAAVPTQNAASTEAPVASVPAATEVQATEAPVKNSNKSITMVIAEDPPSFNPVVSDTGYDALVMELVMLGMTDIDPDGNIFPELAAELPTRENGEVVLDENAGTMSVTWNIADWKIK